MKQITNWFSPPEEVEVVIIYEDESRTMKLLEQLSRAPFFPMLKIDLMDASVKAGLIHTSIASDIGPSVILLSRTSGSYGSRGNILSPSIMQSVLFAAERSNRYQVLNGCSAFNVEMNKMLANIYIESADFTRAFGKYVRVPSTIGLTSLNEKVVHKALAGEHRFAETCFIKGLVGGGSTTVTRLVTGGGGDSLSSQLRSMQKKLERLQARPDIFLIQDACPSDEGRENVQYRFELVDHRLLYVVRVEKLAADAPSAGCARFLPFLRARAPQFSALRCRFASRPSVTSQSSCPDSFKNAAIGPFTRIPGNSGTVKGRNCLASAKQACDALKRLVCAGGSTDPPLLTIGSNLEFIKYSSQP